jgi:hypothetical protein
MRVLALGFVTVMMICLLNAGYRTCIDLMVKANGIMLVDKLVE